MRSAEPRREGSACPRGRGAPGRGSAIRLDASTYLLRRVCTKRGDGSDLAGSLSPSSHFGWISTMTRIAKIAAVWPRKTPSGLELRGHRNERCAVRRRVDATAGQAKDRTERVRDIGRYCGCQSSAPARHIHLESYAATSAARRDEGTATVTAVFVRHLALGYVT